MLHYFLSPLSNINIFFNLFTYISFRAILATLFGLLFTIIIGKYFIIYMSPKNNVLRKLTPKIHKNKQGTPSLGGLVILIALTLSVLLTANFENYLISLSLLTFWGFALIGLIDDLIKMNKNKGKGLSPKLKMILLLVVSLGATLGLVYNQENIQIVTLDKNVSISYFYLTVPFLKNTLVNLSYFYIPFSIFILLSSSNAVNLTDGLDGLAIGLSLLVISTFLIFSYISGNKFSSEYLQTPYIKSSGEYTVFLAALVGTGLGFLWYNSHPAEIFMGDTGSLALGGIIGLTALILKQELLLPIIGGIFVIEALSVIIQVVSYKTRKKRIFKMAPLHHHYELLGLKESKIITRFWLVGIILALLSIATLKIR